MKITLREDENQRQGGLGWEEKRIKTPLNVYATPSFSFANLQMGIEDGVRNLIAQLIRMSLSDRLGGEQESRGTA